MNLYEVLSVLRRAAKDPNVNRIILHLNNYSGGFATSQELGESLANTREQGKEVIAVASYFLSVPQYLLATYADQIYLPDGGGVFLSGLSAGQLYLGSALKQLGISMHEFRTGPYKTAGEELTRNNMSDGEKEQLQVMIDTLWRHFRQQVMQNRNLSQEQFNRAFDLEQIANSYEGDPSDAALDMGLIDSIIPYYEEDYESSAYERFFLSPSDAQMHGWQYLQSWDSTEEEKENHIRIAVINVNGAIINSNEDGSVSPNNVSEQLEHLQETADALIVRVNSPGGVPDASEAIRSMFVNSSFKKMYVSMGNVAASGGYWVAMQDASIWASPYTITGSIGVVSVFPTVEEALKKLSINYDFVQTPGNITAAGLFKSPNNELTSLLRAVQGKIYSDFLNLVARERDLELKRVKQLAQGRVWMAEHALENQLVDQLGTLQELAEHIREESDAATYSLHYYQPKLNFFDYVQNLLASRAAQVSLLQAHPAVALLLNEIKSRAYPLWHKIINQDYRPETFVWCNLCLN